VNQRLFGFQRVPIETDRAKELVESSTSDYIDAIRLLRDILPMAQSPEQASSIALPQRCWTVDGNAFACFAPPAAGQLIVLTGFAVRAEAQGLGKGTELFAAIQAAHPASAWILPQVIPEALCGFLERLGFKRMELNQFEMRLRL
jgi:N-acetylglutamate synthase-like GNAT family acetyltransferase